MLSPRTAFEDIAATDAQWYAPMERYCQTQGLVLSRIPPLNSCGTPNFSAIRKYIVDFAHDPFSPLNVRCNHCLCARAALIVKLILWVL